MYRSHTILWICNGAALALAGCGGFDIDMRQPQSGFTTADAARTAVAPRPSPDARGVIVYPDYQVAVAQPNDTVGAVANRIGVNPTELARYNALTPDTALRAGEVLALPRNVAIASAPATASGGIQISTLADTAISRAQSGLPGTAPAPATQPAGSQPTRHVVERGETAFTIARLYNVNARTLADWNGLDPEMRVREGQTLMVPVGQTALAATPAASSPATGTPIVARPLEPVTQPGAGSPTPVPPLAATPMPAPARPAAQAQAAAEAARPASPNMAQERSTAAAPSSFVMPVDGRVIRAYAPGRNEGIGIAAAAGTTVKAAAAGTVAAITKTTGNVTIMVIRHDGGVLTVYANIDGLSVAKDARVTRGQAIAKVASGDPSFLHFEVRRGQESVDPMRFLQ